MKRQPFWSWIVIRAWRILLQLKWLNKTIWQFSLFQHTLHTTLWVWYSTTNERFVFKHFKGLMNDFNVNETNLGHLRIFCYLAALISWDGKANMQSCMKDAIVIKFCSCTNTDLLSSNFIVEITHLTVKFIKQKK